MTIHPEDQNDDLVEKLLKKTGCLELHYKLQECIVDKRDWRQCQEEVQEFRACMNRHQKDKTISAN